MTGSMYASVAGLRAHMQKLSVIGNNVANVNTQGYKKQRTMFRDSVYSMYTSGGDGTETVGGINPSQIGYGSMVGSIDLNMSSASYNPGNPTDCALVGDGFFLVGDKTVANSIDGSDPSTLKSLTLTRVGDFQFRADGFLCDGKGNVVYGFMTTGTDTNGDPIVSDQLVPIRKPHWERVPTTEKQEDPNNPDKEIEVDTYKYEIRYATDVVSTADDGTKTIGRLTDQKKPLHESNRVNRLTGAKMTEEEMKADPDLVADLDYAEFSNITISQDTGAITGICREGDLPVVIGYLAIGSVTNPNGVTHTGNSYYKCQDGAGDLRICMLGGVQKELGITNVNSYMCKKTDPNNPDAADTTPYPPGTAILSTGGTKMMVGFLEAPNVDLAEEISELITTQRGYQANTRIITVTDSMLEELVNMKR